MLIRTAFIVAAMVAVWSVIFVLPRVKSGLFISFTFGLYITTLYKDNNELGKHCLFGILMLAFSYLWTPGLKSKASIELPKAAILFLCWMF